MKIRRTSVTLAVALAVAAGGLAPAASAASAAGRLRAVAPTHVGVPASSIVVLTGSTGGSGRFQFSRIIDGGALQVDYAVPAGMSLVVTDVIWWSRAPATPGSQQILSLKVTPAGVPVFYDPAVATASGAASGSEHMTTGFVVPSGQKLLLVNYPGGSTTGLGAMVYGYLVG